MNHLTFKGPLRAGIILIGLGVLLFTAQYFPIIVEEAYYQMTRFQQRDAEIHFHSGSLVPYVKENKSHKNRSEKEIIVPESNQFTLIIPKIYLNRRILPDVDPYKEEEYRAALNQGIAHAESTAYPEQIGNMVLFAHSTDNFYNANRLSAVFYLLNKLEKGDTIYVIYKNRLFEYEVTKTAIVEPEDINYMERADDRRVTLITCWPPGTTIKRLVVIADEKR